MGVYPKAFFTLRPMTAILAAFLVLLSFAVPLQAAGFGTPLDTPQLSEPLATAHFFDTDRFLTNAGVRYSATTDLTLEPELGIGYRGTDQELHGGFGQSTHRLHARAGWRLTIAESLYFSAAAKLPMLTVESVGLYGGEELGTRPVDAHQGYDLMNPSRSPLRWTGELGIRLSPQTGLTLYYDQSPLTGWSYSGMHQEERIGTRFIIRFK